MSRELLEQALGDIREIVEKFSIRGPGVSGSLRSGYIVNAQGAPPHIGQAQAGGGASPPTSTGACCGSDGCCTVTTEADCSGTYQGDGTVCEPSPCPTGACCYGTPASSCVITTSCDCALTYGGTYAGNGTNCDSGCEGVCCCPTTGPHACTLTYADECTGTWHLSGDCRPCMCACCLPATPPPCCEIVTLQECEDVGGTFVEYCGSCTPPPCSCSADIFDELELLNV